MVGALLKDWIVGLAVLLWLGSLALYAFPGVPESWLMAFGSRFYAIPSLVSIVCAAWIGVSRIPDASERRFWVVLGSGFAAWLIVSIPYSII